MAARKGGGLNKGILLAIGVVCAIYVVRRMGTGNATEWVDEFVKNQGVVGEAIFVAMGVAATAAGVPRQVIAFLGGYAFGVLGGSALALTAQLGGGLLAFLWAREIGQSWANEQLEGRFGRRLRTLQTVLVENAFGSILALRLVPIGNNLALNLLSGVAGVGVVPFVLASAIGYLPQTVIFALLGEGLKVEETIKLGVAVAAFLVSGLIGLILLRRHRAAQAMAADAEDERTRNLM